MLRQTAPFAVDAPLSPRLAAVLDYWRSLRRGQADIPFSDDLDLPKAQAACEDVFLLGVFGPPERFRVELAHTPHAPRVEGELQGRFLDEFDLPTPLEYLRAQASAAVEAGDATCYRHSPAGSELRYVRLLLPLWGEGQIRLLLGAVEWL